MLRRAVARPVLLVAATGLVGLTAWLTGRSATSSFTCVPNVATAEAEVVREPTATVAFKDNSLSPPFGRGPALTFTDQDLRHQRWAHASLPGVFFDRCDLRSADLRHAVLCDGLITESDLRGALLDGADLSGLVYDDLTRWPEGFDPKAHGARREE